MCSQLFMDQYADRLLLKNIIETFRLLHPKLKPDPDHIENLVNNYVDYFPISCRRQKNMVWQGNNIAMKSLLALYLETQIHKMGFRVRRETGLYFLKEIADYSDASIEAVYTPIEDIDLLIIDDAGQDYRWLNRRQAQSLHRLFSVREQLKLPYLFLSHLELSQWISLFGMNMERHFQNSNCTCTVFKS